MGKRKSSSKPQGPKKREPLETVFACLFCNHEKSVTVKLDKKAGVGKLECKVCGQSFQCGVNYLSAGVDVYSEWVDACDAVAKENSGDGASTSTRKAPGRMRFDDLDQDDEELGGGYGAEGVVGDEEED